jgi:hypothetical protein
MLSTSILHKYNQVSQSFSIRSFKTAVKPEYVYSTQSIIKFPNNLVYALLCVTRLQTTGSEWMRAMLSTSILHKYNQ